MTDLQTYLFLRLGLPAKENVLFEDLPEILFRMGKNLPYENLDIMEKSIKNISRENLIDKLLLKQRGGLCYELNSLLYYFLMDCGFQVYKVAGTIYDLKDNKWKPDDGHVIIIMIYKNQQYIIDGGFASHLPLYPVSFNEETISSQTGKYRIRKRDTSKGTFVLEMKKGMEGETADFLGSEPTNSWKVGYAFTLEKIDEVKVNKIQRVILEHKDSPFNKGHIICRLTNTGHISLTKKSFTETHNGKKSKKIIDEKEYEKILIEEFGIKQERQLL
ncbi:arylamine N-acetyltransferase [Bacillus sp. dmp10]|uniref:arylamine N-acetyltransferase family protein n=1 Tax=Bacillus sp. dmp10 TaxID=2293321 RepID=UPI000E2F9D3D|nr:arylamine N-acetyltransferase [Bacillus sp. dmp10]